MTDFDCSDRLDLDSRPAAAAGLGAGRERERDIETLLAAGADVDALIAAGVLAIEPKEWGWQDTQEMAELDRAATQALLQRVAAAWGMILEGP